MTEQLVHYNRVARVLHWTIGGLILLNILLGIFHKPLGLGGINAHKSFGVLILLLSLYRLYWRISHPAPPLPAAMPGWEKAAAHGLHWLFYALMIFMPLSGWVFSSAGKWPIPFFGLFEIPKLAVDKSMPIVGVLHEAHELLGLTWGALIILHVAAALRHQFILKDGVLNRMWRAAPEG